MEKPTLGELAARIERDTVAYGGRLPERAAIAWSGYLAATIEWGLLTVSEHHKLCEMLPPINANPAVSILLGEPPATHI